ncbi:MAG TPA: hypothetical protein VHA14_07630 [Bryobacteraceae bacterium]|nr:hypothetical protein [Bryobacteraceae bacterium]
MPTVEELTDALLDVFEGAPRLEAFQDSGGVWTVGRGHTGPDVKAGTVISREQSTAYLKADEAPLFRQVAGLPLLSAAAHASFGYNCGAGALHAVLSGNDSIDNPKHTTDRHGVIQRGLVARRRLESMLIQISQESQK